MNMIDMVRRQTERFGGAWLDDIRVEIGADLIGVLEVREDSYPDFVSGVKTLLPTAKAAVMLGMEYDSETLNLLNFPQKFEGKAKAGVLLEPHVLQLNREIDNAVAMMVKRLKREGYRSLSLPSRGMPLLRPKDFKTASSYVKSPISYTHVAEAAGMGTIGTHSLLITPEFGTRVRLAGLLTEAPIRGTKRIDPIDDCTHCLDCVKICPVGAIQLPPNNRRYAIAGDRCKFYRERIDNCGMCQKICSYATGHSETTGGPLRANAEFQESLSLSFSAHDNEEW